MPDAHLFPAPGGHPTPLETQRASDLLEGLQEGFQVVDYEWRYLYVNPVAARHGRKKSPQDLIGRRMPEVYPGIEHTPAFAVLERCMRDRVEQVYESEFTFPDDVRRWFEIRVHPVPEGICIYSRDIEARKARERADQAPQEDVDGRVRSLWRCWRVLAGGSSESWR